MLIERLYLRNYRVFEDEVDLELPPGLVGVYGPNGAGKSTILEAVLWALWGKARTTKEEIPTAGSHGECVAEVTFEHEGHLYVARRRISGATATVQAQVNCDNLVVAEGVRDTARYMHSVLGMDDAAFRASVFAEQNQVAAFSGHSPADRRKLVLSLLGVTPLDGARDRARQDARVAEDQHARLQGMLPDLQEAEVSLADAEARSAAAEETATEEERAAVSAKDRAASTEEAFLRLDRLRQEHDMLVVEGKAARTELERAKADVERLSAELAGLAEAEARLAELEPAASTLDGARDRAQLLDALAGAAAELDGLPDVPALAPPDEEGLAAASQAAMAAQAALGAAKGGSDAAERELARAKHALEQAASLSGQESCPLCGQSLGDAFGQVQAHRASELASAEQTLSEAKKELDAASKAARQADKELRRITEAVETAREAQARYQQARARREGAVARLEGALGALRAHDPELAGKLGPAPALPVVTEVLALATRQLEECRKASEEANRVRGRLEHRPQAELALTEAEERADSASALVETLEAKVKGLGFDAGALDAARAALADAKSAAEEADGLAREARVAAATARAGAEAASKRLAEARGQHERLAALQSESVHLRRTAELLNAFRTSVVASVGPRLAAEAASLFAELTDNEYDRLEVDAETYGLQISDGGVAYDLERFSGSEVDLANLALRVAISEHVRFMSGGAVGLLVLDEVFGPLDDERRTRMLLALERLRARFRQILVVTHSTDIKEQLPSAIEVQKRPGRRAALRLVGPAE
ncbi:MAG: SMC family ATPase [Actinomycetota bacterium]|nr:SMC family ATPase [Actinomycetota bacterium]